MYILFFILFSEKVSALRYNQPCTTTCGLPGLICVGGRCLCDWKLGLFWTGARCLACPKNWMTTDTKCVRYFPTKATWPVAASTCHDLQAELISFHDPSILSLMYQVTGNAPGRKKRVPAIFDTIAGWTSARAIQLNGLGLYQWGDKSLAKFDSTSSWWCRRGIVGFGFDYPFNEPTRNYFEGVGESCVLYRRGKTSTGVLCLDDIFCNVEFPFVCEKTESTAQQYIGPPPVDDGSGGGGGSGGGTSSGGDGPGGGTSGGGSSGGGTSGGGSGSGGGTSGGGGGTSGSGSSGVGTSGGGSSSGNTSGSGGSYTPNNHDGGTGFDSQALESKRKSKLTIVVVIVVALLLLVGALIGGFFFMKRRNTTAAQFQVDKRPKKDIRPPVDAQSPIKTEAQVSNINDVDELATQRMKSDETGLALNIGAGPGNMGLNIGNQKQKKNTRGGYSKQQFGDEFE